MTEYCPILDHDGAKVPVTREVTTNVSPTVILRCSYCAEGLVAWLLHEGVTVTVRPIP